MGNRDLTTVHVVAVSDASAADGLKFRMEDGNGHELETLVFRKDEKGMHIGDVHEIHFQLEQEEGLGLVYAPDLDNAMWVNRGTAQNIPSCPQAKPAKTNAVFYAEKREDLMLTVINKNPVKCYYRFSLNFVAPGTTDPSRLIRYDPIGENQNGGIGRADTWSAQAIVIGTVALLAVAVVAYLAFNQ